MCALLMFGFGFALIPLYDIMCEALGINGKTNDTAALQPQGLSLDTSRLIRVEFMAHKHPSMPWRFEPAQQVMMVHPGQVMETWYEASNLSNYSTLGQAVPSVSPGIGATYFNKIECFCFNQQLLQSRASVRMPLIFYIEPDIPDSIHTLTLSYTLFDISEKAAKQSQSFNKFSDPMAKNPLSMQGVMR